MEGSQEEGRTGPRERYLVYRGDEVVARITSVVGLATALRPDITDSDGTVSFAGVLEGTQWFREWAQVIEARIIDVVEKQRQRRIRLHVSQLIDPSQTGETFEAIVEKAEQL